MVSLKGMSKEAAQKLAKDDVFKVAGIEHYVGCSGRKSGT